MRTFFAGVGFACLVVRGAAPENNASPFLGRWDFNIQTPSGMRANWLSLQNEGDKFQLLFQPTGGNVHPVSDFRIDGNHLSFTATPATAKQPAMTWDLTASGEKLTGVQKQGEALTPLNGVRAPELKRSVPAAWTKPEPLFNGKDLNGWEPIGATSNNHWIVKDGVLLNEAHGANLKSIREFEDFKVHFEVNCPDEANSGFYLRGRYELQLAYEPQKSEPKERRMGAIYGRIAPSLELPPTPHKWEAFDVTLVGRNVTVVRNGTTVIDHKEIEGITGGALNADEGNPGPFYIQGDHTGGLQFRNITVSVPKH